MKHCNGTRTNPTCPRDAAFVITEQRTKKNTASIEVCGLCLPQAIYTRSIWHVVRLERLKD